VFESLFGEIDDLVVRANEGDQLILSEAIRLSVQRRGRGCKRSRSSRRMTRSWTLSGYERSFVTGMMTKGQEEEPSEDIFDGARDEIGEDQVGKHDEE